jgi:hypothetical protein
VPPLRFDRSRIERLLEQAAARLDGEWLLIGGGAAAVWFAAGRTTEDIDLIGLGGSQAERFALMELAIEAGIPIEAVNSAADFFVRRISNWRQELVPLIHDRAIIYRPSATLFLLLKIERLTAVDLDDCAALLAHCRAAGEPVDLERVRARIEALPATEDAALAHRRTSLLGILTAPELPSV